MLLINQSHTKKGPEDRPFLLLVVRWDGCQALAPWTTYFISWRSPI